MQCPFVCPVILQYFQGHFCRKENVCRKLCKYDSLRHYILSAAFTGTSFYILLKFDERGGGLAVVIIPSGGENGKHNFSLSCGIHAE